MAAATFKNLLSVLTWEEEESIIDTKAPGS